jgi:hypothetical protein
MRGYTPRGPGGRFFACAAFPVVSAIVASGCGTWSSPIGQDWQRDLLVGLTTLAPNLVALPVAGPVGAAGPAGQDGAAGPAIIICRGVLNADGTLENTDHITNVLHPVAGDYELTIDTTGQTLPAGTTAADFEVFVTLKETAAGAIAVYYVPVSLVGTDLRIDIHLAAPGAAVPDHGFSIEILLPAG